MNLSDIFTSLPAYDFLFSEDYKVYTFLLVGVWVGVWKAIALWYSARYSQKWWFIFMIISNTLGVLEIIYLFFFKAKDPWKNNLKNKFSSIRGISKSYSTVRENMTNANLKNKTRKNNKS